MFILPNNCSHHDTRRATGSANGVSFMPPQPKFSPCSSHFPCPFSLFLTLETYQIGQGLNLWKNPSAFGPTGFSSLIMMKVPIKIKTAWTRRF